MKRKLAALLIYMLPSLCPAAVMTLKVSDPGAVNARCEDALDQIISARTEIETGEGLACLATDAISSSDRETIKNGFLVRCETKAQARLERAYGSAITIEIEELWEAFNDDYRPLFTANCSGAESKRIAAQNAAQSRTSVNISQGNSRGMMESWYKKNGF